MKFGIKVHEFNPIRRLYLVKKQTHYLSYLVKINIKPTVLYRFIINGPAEDYFEVGSFRFMQKVFSPLVNGFNYLYIFKTLYRGQIKLSDCKQIIGTPLTKQKHKM